MICDYYLYVIEVGDASELQCIEITATLLFHPPSAIVVCNVRANSQKHDEN